MSRYLFATPAAATDEELAPHVEVYRRYRREWESLFAEVRRRGLRWAAPVRPPAFAVGAA